MSAIVLVRLRWVQRLTNDCTGMRVDSCAKKYAYIENKIVVV
jgi:hypothetical protein